MSTLDSLDKDIMSNDSMDVIYLKYAQASDIAKSLTQYLEVLKWLRTKTVITIWEKSCPYYFFCRRKS